MKQKNNTRKSAAIILILITILVIVAQARSQAPPKKYALLIGIDHYLAITQGVPTLNYAVADVDTLKDILEQQGYAVTVRKNEDAERRKILLELYRLAQETTENDIFVLFYAGHGVRNKVVNNNTYWLTYDADLRALDVAGIRLRHLLDYIQDIKARYKLILLDHCFSGDLVRGGGSAGGGRSGGSGSLTIERNVVPLTDIERQIRERGEGMVIIAAAANQAIESASLGHGIFTASLVKAFTSKEGDSNDNNQLEIEELTRYLKDEVPRLARSEANYEQDIVESTVGINLTGWKVADLSLDNSQKAKEITQEYKNTIDKWYLKGWISTITSIQCPKALDKWVESIETGQVMDSKNKRIVDKIREIMKITIFEEKDLAERLNTFVENIINE